MIKIKTQVALISYLLLSSYSVQAAPEYWPEESRIKVIEESQIINCELKGEIQGISYLYRPVFGEKATKLALEQAVKQAEDMNADSVRFEEVYELQNGATQVKGKAYTCDQQSWKVN